MVAPDKVVVVTLSVGGGPEFTVTVTVALPDLVASATLVAVTVAFVVEETVGAVYNPEFETDPEDAVQVTATFEVLLTSAINCCSAPDDNVTFAGVTATATLPVFDTVTSKGWLAECELESVADTVKLYDPVLLGMPETVPVVAPRTNPAGS